MSPTQSNPSSALVQIVRMLAERGYRFTTITPASHLSVLNRKQGGQGRGAASDLRDVFGWSMPFEAELLGHELVQLLDDAEVLVRRPDGLFQSAVRLSTLNGLTLLHSAFPTEAADSVFFGPDTYRFCDFILREARPVDAVLDLGCGSGAGGVSLVAAGLAATALLTDINPRALMMAEVNALVAGVPAVVQFSDVLRDVPDVLPLCIANPPYMRDALGRSYRDGGGAHGEGLAIRMVSEWAERAPRGHRFLLYTGTPVVAGTDVVLSSLQRLCRQHSLQMEYAELDPDVFGEELQNPGYVDVERIAAVGAVITR